jgi:hypothetical protein
MNTARTLVIGDIHGCWEELQALLLACERAPEDEVLAVGDLVDRGPKPLEVVRFIMNDPNAHSLLGNHEDSHLRIRAGEPLHPEDSSVVTRHQLAEAYDEVLDWFATLPLYQERHGHLVVHAGFIPGLSLEEQPRQAILRGRMPWMKSLFDNSQAHWWERYEGTMPIVHGHYFGHGLGEKPRHANNTWGIDNGACFGGSLTALILPEGRTVQVQAATDHWKAVRAAHSALIDEWHAQVRAAREARKKTRKRHHVELDGEAIDGDFLLSYYGAKEGGPWIGELLRRIHSAVEEGRLGTIEGLEAFLPRSQPGAGLKEREDDED